MKKALLILITLLLLGAVAFTLFTKFSKKEAFYLNDEYYGTSSFIEIDNEKLKALEKDKTSFVIFIYQPLCTTSYDFNNVLTEFLDTYKMSFYKTPFSTIKDTNMNECIKFYPSVAIYQDGKVVAYLEANKDKDLHYYESVQGFKEWLTKYVLLEK